MRVKEEEKVEVKKNIIDFLKTTKDSCNLSEIARAINRAPPTVMKYIAELSEEGKVSVSDKKSMKLIKLVRS